MATIEDGGSVSEDGVTPGTGSEPQGASSSGAQERPRWQPWQRPRGAGAGGAPRRPPPSPFVRWGLLGGIGLFVVLFVAAIVSRSGPDLPPRTVEDQEFVRRANAACARSLPALREDRQQRDPNQREEAVLEARVERTADELERLEADVRSIPIAPADQAEVGRWLDDWDAYIAVGRRFADALGRRDNKSYGRIAAESTRFSERIFAFAKANGMPECVF